MNNRTNNDNNYKLFYNESKLSDEKKYPISNIKSSPYLKNNFNKVIPKNFYPKNQLEIENLKREAEENFSKICSFKPKLTSQNILKGEGNESNEDLLDRLATPKIKQYNNRKKQKDLKENEYVIFNIHCRLTKIAHLNQILRKLLQVIRLTRTTKIFFPCKID